MTRDVLSLELIILNIFDQTFALFQFNFVVIYDVVTSVAPLFLTQLFVPGRVRLG